MTCHTIAGHAQELLLPRHLDTGGHRLHGSAFWRVCPSDDDNICRRLAEVRSWPRTGALARALLYAGFSCVASSPRHYLSSAKCVRRWRCDPGDDAVPDVGHRATNRERGLLLDPGDGQVDRASSHAIVDVGEAGERPTEMPSTNGSIWLAGTMRAMYLSGTNAPSSTTSSLCVARMPQRVPGLDDTIATVATRQDSVHDVTKVTCTTDPFRYSSATRCREAGHGTNRALSDHQRCCPALPRNYRVVPTYDGLRNCVIASGGLSGILNALLPGR
jgi:hypothetical protein